MNTNVKLKLNVNRLVAYAAGIFAFVVREERREERRERFGEARL